METLTVCCVEVGDFLGLGERYVRTLQSMCARHLPFPHRFVVLSDREHPGIESIVDPELPASFWAKLHLFKPGRFPGSTLYFDLDVVISDYIGSLPGLLDYGDFWALDDFAWPLSEAEEIKAHASNWHARDIACMLREIGGYGTVNSSVMLWRDEAGRAIWEQYSPEAARGLHGDQNWITRVMRERVQLIPHKFARSYRLGKPGAPITVHHGDGKPHEVHDPHWC